jgi:hypothetical protein
MRWFWIACGMPGEGPRDGVNLPQADTFDPSETGTPIPASSSPESGGSDPLG